MILDLFIWNKVLKAGIGENVDGEMIEKLKLLGKINLIESEANLCVHKKAIQNNNNYKWEFMDSFIKVTEFNRYFERKRLLL